MTLQMDRQMVWLGWVGGRGGGGGNHNISAFSSKSMGIITKTEKDPYIAPAS